MLSDKNSFNVATWNVNSLRVRLPQVLDWLQLHKPDILALQETKLTDAEFPASAFLEAGYECLYHGQKTYNGVALLSRYPLTHPLLGMPNLADTQCRVLSATINNWRIINFYVPNGASVDSEKYLYKLNWLEKAAEFLTNELRQYPHLMVMGDFNIAPDDCDVYDPKGWEGQVLVSPLERDAFRKILACGLQDALRLHHKDTIYTWWDYRQGAFRRNMGLRIDHILVSHELSNICSSCEVDKLPRKHERPSDHIPVLASFSAIPRAF